MTNFEDGNDNKLKPPKMKTWSPEWRKVSKTGYTMPIELPTDYAQLKTARLVQLLGAVFSELDWYWKQIDLDKHNPGRRQEGIRIATENLEKVREALRSRDPKKVQQDMKRFNIPLIALKGTQTA